MRSNGRNHVVNAVRQPAPLVPHVLESMAQQNAVPGIIEPARRAGWMRKRYQAHAVLLEAAADKVVQRDMRKPALDGKAADQKKRFGGDKA